MSSINPSRVSMETTQATAPLTHAAEKDDLDAGMHAMGDVQKALNESPSTPTAPPSPQAANAALTTAAGLPPPPNTPPPAPPLGAGALINANIKQETAAPSTRLGAMQALISVNNKSIATNTPPRPPSQGGEMMDAIIKQQRASANHAPLNVAVQSPPPPPARPTRLQNGTPNGIPKEATTPIEAKSHEEPNRVAKPEISSSHVNETGSAKLPHGGISQEKFDGLIKQLGSEKGSTREAAIMEGLFTRGHKTPPVKGGSERLTSDASDPSQVSKQQPLIVTILKGIFESLFGSKKETEPESTEKPIPVNYLDNKAVLYMKNDKPVLRGSAELGDTPEIKLENGFIVAGNKQFSLEDLETKMLTGAQATKISDEKVNNIKMQKDKNEFVTKMNQAVFNVNPDLDVEVQCRGILKEGEGALINDGSKLQVAIMNKGNITLKDIKFYTFNNTKTNIMEGELANPDPPKSFKSQNMSDLAKELKEFYGVAGEFKFQK